MIDVGCDPGRDLARRWRCGAALVERGAPRLDRQHEPGRNRARRGSRCRAGVVASTAPIAQAAVDWGCRSGRRARRPGDARRASTKPSSYLAGRGVRLRIDPILEPIGFGFAASLGRYLDVRRRYPDAEMMMGIGNLTELTDVDSAPINVVLLGFCQELGIRSVLTTASDQLGPQQRPRVRPGAAAGSLRPAAIARCPSSRAAAGHAPRRRNRCGTATKRSTAWPREIRDPNYRLFAEDGRLHAVTAGLHAADADPFALFERLHGRRATPDRRQPRVLSRLRAGQGGHRADPGQGLPAGRSPRLGLAHRGRMLSSSSTWKCRGRRSAVGNVRRGDPPETERGPRRS